MLLTVDLPIPSEDTTTEIVPVCVMIGSLKDLRMWVEDIELLTGESLEILKDHQKIIVIHMGREENRPQIIAAIESLAPKICETGCIVQLDGVTFFCGKKLIK